jgi:carboxypeptidase Taq
MRIADGVLQDILAQSIDTIRLRYHAVYRIEYVNCCTIECMASNLAQLKRRLFEINALRTAVSIMDWDQQTYMPRKAGEARAEHVGILSRMSHEMFVSHETRNLLEKAIPEAESEDDLAMIRIVKRGYDISTKLPTDLVEEKSRLSAKAHEAWIEARAMSNFSKFEPILTRMFDIVREEAECIGYTNHIYDALIDHYEEGSSHAECTQIFATLKQPLINLLKEIMDAPRIDDNAFYGEWDRDKQRMFTEEIVEGIGFDMSRGRQDVAPHPFCTNFSINDVRLTTRYLPYIGSAIFGSLHEAGHGLYEQNSPQEWDRTPLAGGVSLGIHESQSRLWENIVGRSRPFWKFYLPKLQNSFPDLKGFDLETFYRTINKVEPTYVRVEAD